MDTKELNRQIEKKKSLFKMFRDYYDGGGKQWKLHGQITRSGYWLVDKLDNQITDEEIDAIDKALTSDTIGGQDMSDYLQKIKRKRRWAEHNVIEIGIDEAVKVIKGNGNITFNLGDSEMLSEQFTKYLGNNAFGYKFKKIITNTKIYGYQPFLCLMDKITLLEPHTVEFFGDDEDVTFSAYEYKVQSRQQLEDYFLNYGLILSLQQDKDSFEYSAFYDATRIDYYIDGKLIYTIDHNLGFCPMQRFKNPDDSQVEEDIPIQDQINIILTESSEVFKAHLNPAVSIHDDELMKIAQKKAKSGQMMNIERGPATVMITGKDGKVQYVQWEGLPKGTLEMLDEHKNYFQSKRGVMLFHKNNALPESGEAKKEAKAVLYSEAQDWRDYNNIVFQNIANIFLAFRGYNPLELEVHYPPLYEVSETEKAKLEKEHWNIHQNPLLYMKRVGTFTEEEIQEVNANSNIPELIET